MSDKKNFSRLRPPGKSSCIATLAIIMLAAFEISAKPTENRPIAPARLHLGTCGCPTEIDLPECELIIDEFGTADGSTLYGAGRIVLTNSGGSQGQVTSVAVCLAEFTEEPSGNAMGPDGRQWKVLAAAVANASAPCREMGVARTCFGPIVGGENDYLDLYEADGIALLLSPEALLIPPTSDNDGDGVRDEDPAAPCGRDDDGDGQVDEDPPGDLDGDGNPDDDNDGLFDEDGPDDDNDGLIDEDGACEDARTIAFAYQLDIAGLGISGPGDGMVPSSDDLSVNLVVTFKGAGPGIDRQAVPNGRGKGLGHLKAAADARGGRGASQCTLDADCDGAIASDDPATPGINESENRNLRSLLYKMRFDPVPCNEAPGPDEPPSGGDDMPV